MYGKDKLLNRHEALRLFNDKQHIKDPVIKNITHIKGKSESCTVRRQGAYMIMEVQSKYEELRMY